MYRLAELLCCLQAGAFQPFYRAHSILESKRREPWLFDAETTRLVREAIRLRYSYLPMWYTLFYEHERFGLPVMRPLWAEFPHEAETFAMDDQYLLGMSNPRILHSPLSLDIVASRIGKLRLYDCYTTPVIRDIDELCGLPTHELHVLVLYVP